MQAVAYSSIVRLVAEATGVRPPAPRRFLRGAKNFALAGSLTEANREIRRPEAPRRTLAATEAMSRTLPRTLSIAVVMASLLGTSAGSSDPLALHTAFSDPASRARIDAGLAVVDVPPARGRDLGVFGAARTDVDGDRLVAWVRQIEHFHKGSYVPLVVRFSDPPRIEDLDLVVLDAGDLDDIRRCRPGDCGLKLAADEIAQLRQTIATSGAEWQLAVQERFRRIVFDRVQAYLAAGYDRTPPYSDHATVVPPGGEFDIVANRVRSGMRYETGVLDYLQHYPYRRDDDVESFLYWSKETLGSGKPILSVTHVAIVRGTDARCPEALVASKQVFATHYLSASLSLTALTYPSAEGRRYLLYSRFSRVDLFQGVLAGVVRRLVEKRIRTEAPVVLDAMRRRMESDLPSTRLTALPVTPLRGIFVRNAE